MSISAFHGGLEWRNDSSESQAAAQDMSIGQAAQAVQSAGSDGLSSRDINEFFNPRESDLTLEERYQ